MTASAQAAQKRHEASPGASATRKDARRSARPSSPTSRSARASRRSLGDEERVQARTWVRPMGRAGREADEAPKRARTVEPGDNSPTQHLRGYPAERAEQPSLGPGHGFNELQHLIEYRFSPTLESEHGCDKDFPRTTIPGQPGPRGSDASLPRHPEGVDSSLDALLQRSEVAQPVVRLICCRIAQAPEKGNIFRVPLENVRGVSASHGKTSGLTLVLETDPGRSITVDQLVVAPGSGEIWSRSFLRVESCTLARSGRPNLEEPPAPAQQRQLKRRRRSNALRSLPQRLVECRP